MPRPGRSRPAPAVRVQACLPPARPAQAEPGFPPLVQPVPWPARAVSSWIGQAGRDCRGTGGAGLGEGGARAGAPPGAKGAAWGAALPSTFSGQTRACSTAPAVSGHGRRGALPVRPLPAPRIWAHGMRMPPVPDRRWAALAQCHPLRSAPSPALSAIPCAQRHPLHEPRGERQVPSAPDRRRCRASARPGAAREDGACQKTLQGSQRPPERPARGAPGGSGARIAALGAPAPPQPSGPGERGTDAVGEAAGRAIRGAGGRCARGGLECPAPQPEHRAGGQASAHLLDGSWSAGGLRGTLPLRRRKTPTSAARQARGRS
jgi:hypothetical protein